MDEEFIAKLANLYNSFQNTLESKIKDKEISSNNEECYLIKLLKIMNYAGNTIDIHLNHLALCQNLLILLMIFLQ